MLTGIRKISKRKSYFECKLCGKMGNHFECTFQHISVVPDHTPHIYKPICKRCLYKASFGLKRYTKKMKEGALDGKEKER